MNQKGRSNNQYFETFAFGDSSEMADELLKLVLDGRGYIFDDTTPICFEIFELTEVF